MGSVNSCETLQAPQRAANSKKLGRSFRLEQCKSKLPLPTLWVQPLQIGHERDNQEDQEAAQDDESEEQRPQLLWLRSRGLALLLHVIERAVIVSLARG